MRSSHIKDKRSLGYRLTEIHIKTCAGHVKNHLKDTDLVRKKLADITKKDVERFIASMMEEGKSVVLVNRAPG